jgi:hypothetical protein
MSAVNITNIPAELRALKCWQAHVDKSPRDANGAKLTGWQDSANWLTFDDAVARAGTFKGASVGIGVMIPALFAAGIIALDLDGPVAHEGAAHPDARTVIQVADSYTEFSPSGTGFHILIKAGLPEADQWARTANWTHPDPNKKGQIEVFAGKVKFMTITGDKLPGVPATINERPDLLQHLFVRKPHASPARKTTAVSQRPDVDVGQQIDTARKALAALKPTRADDRKQWLDVGMALHSVADELLPDWEQWSRQSPKFKEGECADKWAGFRTERDRTITIGSLTLWADEDSVQLTAFANIAEEQITWLWPDVIPYGKLTLFIGDAGLGKTYITVDLAARLSAGKKLPDGTPLTPMHTIMVFCEDGAGDTIKPRLRVHGANESLVHDLRIKDWRGGDTERLLQLDTDLAALERTLRHTGAKLLTIDPLTAYLGRRTNSWKDDDIRRLLGPVARMAERTKCAIVAIMHLNKKQTANVLQRATGAGAFTAVARSVFLVGIEPKDADLPSTQQRQVFTNAKTNLTGTKAGLYFRIKDNPDKIGRLIWEGTTTTTARDVVVHGLGLEVKPDKRTQAASLILGMLSAGPHMADTIYQLGEQQSISRDTMERARKALSEVDRPFQKAGVWWWKLRTRVPLPTAPPEAVASPAAVAEQDAVPGDLPPSMRPDGF